MFTVHKNNLMAKHGKLRFFSFFFCKANLGNGRKMNHLTSKAQISAFIFRKNNNKNQSSNFP